MQKELIFIGLGRMGAAMVEHLNEKAYVVHAFDINEAAREKMNEIGIKTYNSLTETISAASDRKVVWLMVPSNLVDNLLTEITPQLSSNDIIIDGGNSFYKDTIRRATSLKQANLHYVDCGTSGGVTGARNGASLMVGGDIATIDIIENIFIDLAITDGYARVGEAGAGHFVKMVHNSIEYGMMGAIAEGLNFIENNQSELNIDVQAVLKPYKNGSIISSSLMNWMADAYQTEGYLEKISGEVPHGETEVEMESIATHKQNLILEAALQQRKNSRTNPSRIGVFISAMRNQFGGHKTIDKN